uniref:PIN domain-containing protein n=1 Tax=Candidatus Kentrum sp. FM TaxID=2126340 RepID=A0A450SGX1_9GAMM|nr:MAG: hypothetical protein BECKFM1743A_GA0114220_1004911 [Candidatus Kentron sp. FM]VFJ52367.1 MAG: hypothetical protein BECKFM1743C_GA0114222_101084 [Candidatus Kentron sp. FM]VFK07719.1 MAG: hypothetical protein BECKFM1743B_GA0114221_1004911 [Candidatus Kentron sp. FM]
MRGAIIRKIIANHGIPEEYPEDALHIALAAIGGVDFVVTWNFAHINNPFTRIRIRETIESQGLICPQIVSTVTIPVSLDACWVQRPPDDRLQPRTNLEAEAIAAVPYLIE